MSDNYVSNFSKDLRIITRAVENNNLLAVTEKGTFKKVGTFGRLWRVLTRLLSGKSNSESPYGPKIMFEDCYAPRVGNAIVSFVEKNKHRITPEQKNKIIDSLQILKGRLKSNHMNISLNINKINEII